MYICIYIHKYVPNFIELNIVLINITCKQIKEYSLTDFKKLNAFLDQKIFSPFSAKKTSRPTLFGPK
jgi:hypothetical protein